MENPRTILEDLQQRGVLPLNANLWFEQIAMYKDGVTHVLCYDATMVGNHDLSFSRPMLACTDEELYNDDEYMSKNLRNRTLLEILELITCDRCHNELVRTWMRSGKFDDGDGIHLFREIQEGA